MPSKTKPTQPNARERILDSAYQLFIRNGISGTGINEVLSHSGAAKATLYRTYSSKTDLAHAVLLRRGELWTVGWLEVEVEQQSSEPREQLLAIFDVLDKWCRSKAFEGCLFIRVLHEPKVEAELRKAAVDQLALVRTWIQQLANSAGLAEAKQFAMTWHAMMNGAIVAANAGHKRAGADAKRAATFIIDGWPKSQAPRQNGPAARK